MKVYGLSENRFKHITVFFFFFDDRREPGILNLSRYCCYEFYIAFKLVH